MISRVSLIEACRTQCGGPMRHHANRIRNRVGTHRIENRQCVRARTCLACCVSANRTPPRVTGRLACLPFLYTTPGTL
jgi:hypothetical protein